MAKHYEIEIKMVDGMVFNVIKEAHNTDDLERALTRGWFNAGNDLQKKLINTSHIVYFDIKGHNGHLF